MREIKFRAWDKKQKRWANLQLSEMEFTRDGLLRVGETIEYGTHAEFNDFELMQYTGLKDKNGKEIYEGDIVRYKEFERFRDSESVHVSVVEYYCEPNNRVGFAPMVWHTKVEDGYYNSELEDYEVIGNIYEHEHLLTEGR